MENRQSESYFSSICVEACGGACCDPWWGIISYQMIKEGGLGSLASLKNEILKGIRAREARIVDTYATGERPSRRLFSSPERYNVRLRGVRLSGSTLTLEILAMYAFRCRFLSEDKRCLIHPSVTGAEVRPPHCGYMGKPGVTPNEKGYCRIIHAAEDGPDKVEGALKMERGTSFKHFEGGVLTAEEAAERVAGEARAYCEENAPQLLPAEKKESVGRNDPCWCGSGKKFKKCHGG